MREIGIRHISLDETGRLLVVPALPPEEDLAFIYRAAMKVTWSASARGLLSPALQPGGWSYSDWFQQILRAAADEYGTKLEIDAHTTWSVPDDVRKQIEARRAAT